MGDILSLADNHLIYQQESESNVMAKDEKLNFYFNGAPLKLSCKKPNMSFQFYKFTPIGSELASLISDKPNDDFFSALKEQLRHYFEIANRE